MEKDKVLSFDTDELPVTVQIFLWKQVRPFIRAKMGKVHEASCVYCQHTPGHYELKEACTVLEKVLVQNIYTDLTPSLNNSLKQVSRWTVLRASLPYILHATASLLNCKKDYENVGAVEANLLYILNWIMIDGIETCKEQTFNSIGVKNPYHCLFSIPTITLFVYLFAPLFHYMKDIDFKLNSRLEKGFQIWHPLCEAKLPQLPCFAAQCLPNSKVGRETINNLSRGYEKFEACLLDDNKLNEQYGYSSCKKFENLMENQESDYDNNSRITSPKEKMFPETIPEESSSNEDEHVVIFTLPPFGPAENIMEGVKEVSTIFAGDASIFHVAMGRGNSSKPSLSIDNITPEKDLPFLENRNLPKEDNRGKNVKKKDINNITPYTYSMLKNRNESYQKTLFEKKSFLSDDIQSTYLDVAVTRCLYILHWHEEGIFWALQYILNRLKNINEKKLTELSPRHRSNSLPIPKIEISFYNNSEAKKMKIHSELNSVKEKLKEPVNDKKILEEMLKRSDTSSIQQVFRNNSFYEKDNTDLYLPKEKFKLQQVWSNIPNMANKQQANATCLEEKIFISRSYTDSNINYLSDELTVAAGSFCFITNQGEIDLMALLKALNNISLRDNNICSIRVCEKMLCIIEISTNLLQEEKISLDLHKKSQFKESSNIKNIVNLDNSRKYRNSYKIFHFIIDNSVRLLRHLGCPNGCIDRNRGSQSDVCRLQVQNIFNRLFNISPKYFRKFFKMFINDYDVLDVIDFFHAYIGFCIDAGSLLSPLNHKKVLSKCFDMTTNLGYAINFGEIQEIIPRKTCRLNTSVKNRNNLEFIVNQNNTSVINNKICSIEFKIINYIFKTFIARIASYPYQLIIQENLNLYNDIRQFISYVKEVHGGIFRRVALSSILDSTDRPHKKIGKEIRMTKIIRHHLHFENGQCFYDYPYHLCDLRSTNKFLCKKRSNLSMIIGKEVNDEIYNQKSSENSKKKLFTSSSQPEKNIEINSNSYGKFKPRKRGRINIEGIVNWFRNDSVNKDLVNSQDDSDSQCENILGIHQNFLRKKHYRVSQKQSGVSGTLQKARKRVEEKFLKIGFTKEKKKRIY